MARLKSGMLNLILVLASIGICLGALEIFLRVAAAISKPDRALMADAGPQGPVTSVPEELVARAASRYQHLTMPEEWSLKKVDVPGATNAYMWHGTLHIQNDDGMRHFGPYAPKSAGTYRVIVVGDSLTYGWGIPQPATFVELLNNEMSRNFRIEFLNLGVAGDQSEDVLRKLRRFLSILSPNLVIYAVCLNDFLPSGTGEYHYSYAIPLPKEVKDFLFKWTLSARYLGDLYDGTLRTLHVRQDFFDDILSDFGGYQQRFRRDVKEMNASVLGAGLPPMIAMVLDQNPWNSASRKIAAIAEDALRQGGAHVIPLSGFYRDHGSRSFAVSRWEGHPNEVANYIWFQMILKQVIGRDDLKPFAREAVGAATIDEFLSRPTSESRQVR